MSNEIEQIGGNSSGAPRYAPAMLSEIDAAAYLGISKSMLRSLKLPRKLLGARRLYVRCDLDDFYKELPYEDEVTTSATDAWFNAHG